jgi:hypothetical protein
MHTTLASDINPLVGLPMFFIAGGILFLALLAILMPYYVYKAAADLEKMRKIAERWEAWMRSQQ